MCFKIVMAVYKIYNGGQKYLNEQIYCDLKIMSIVKRLLFHQNSPLSLIPAARWSLSPQGCL